MRASSIERTAAFTHIGCVRTKNEDRYLIRKIDDDSRLLAVADGLGGETDGDVAAEIAISALKEIRTGGCETGRSSSSSPYPRPTKPS